MKFSFPAKSIFTFHKSLKRAKVLLACCAHRTINIDAMTHVMGLIVEQKHEITWMPMKGDALIDRCRSRLASYFMQERDDDILFFFDDDENFDPKDIIKIIDNVMNGMDICGGMVMLKKPQNIRQNYIDKNILFFKDQEIVFNKNAKPVQIRFLGSGFMAIHRKVFQAIIDKGDVPLCNPKDVNFWPFFQPFPYKNEDGDWVYLSEDWALCKRAEDLGFKIWLDPSVFIDHYGDYSWNLADALRPSKVKMDENFSLTLR